jgi:hypothetical protein
MTTSDPHDYLDTPAAKLKVEYPHRHAFISDLVTKYKKTLRDGLLHIGRTPEEVIKSPLERLLLRSTKFCPGRSKHHQKVCRSALSDFVLLR